MPSRVSARIALLLSLVLVAGACNDDSPSAPNQPPNSGGAPIVESFTGTLAQNGSTFYSFNVPQTGQVLLTLITLREAGADSTALVSLGIGNPVGTGCNVLTGSVIAAGASPQVSTTQNPGIYCARLGDLGNLTGPATFHVNIARPR
jgi:hypothetical protein